MDLIGFIKDRAKGEVPKAFVTVKQGYAVSEDALLKCCKENLAPYKIPKIQFMDDLPKNPTGKIMKKELPKH